MNSSLHSLYRWFLLALCVALVAGCGFHLRGSGPGLTKPLPFATLHIALPASSELHAMLKRNIEANGTVRVIEAAKDAQAILSILGDQQAKNVLSLDTSGRVREFQLVRTLTFRVHDATGQDWLASQQVSVRRDMAFSDTQVLAKEAEEALLWRDMQGDLVQQLLRRLPTAKAPNAAEAAESAPLPDIPVAPAR